MSIRVSHRTTGLAELGITLPYYAHTVFAFADHSGLSDYFTKIEEHKTTMLEIRYRYGVDGPALVRIDVTLGDRVYPEDWFKESDRSDADQFDAAWSKAMRIIQGEA